MSTVKATTFQNLSGVEMYLAKAWINFNGAGTVAIRASGNVSSITDNATGDYTINFTTALADAKYSVLVGGGTTNNGPGASIMSAAIYDTLTAPTSSAVRILTADMGNTARDYDYVFAVIHR